MGWIKLLCFLFTALFGFPTIASLDEDHDLFFTNTWAVEVKEGKEAAEQLANQYGMRLAGQVGTLEDVFLFENRRLRRRSASENVSLTEAVQHDPRVIWAQQQRVLKRVKRDFVDRDRSRVRPAVNQANIERTPSNHGDLASQSVHQFQFNDAYYDQQWYIHGYVGDQLANVADMKIQQTWNRSYTGKGIVVTILDDGVEHTHSDLSENYDPLASMDLNGRDRDPFPRYDVTNENRHGTRCAGVVAAKANNSVCVAGIAYGARVGGVRMLDGDITDAIEAAALSFAPQYVDIYSASWGPDDSGNVMDGPGPLALKAFQQGIERGRGGLGSIYVWASGNGGGSDDSCAFDGYANSIYTFSVGSVSQWNLRPWYLEECASTLVTTYSSGEPREAQVATTDIHNRCTLQHTGTSASAPIAAGIIALVLEANANLTWRDVQYIAILAANHTPFKDANWVVNAVKRKVSLRYGYGLMNAYSMVRLAEAWSNVPPQRVCRVAPDGAQRKRSLSNTREVTVTVSGERCSYVPTKSGQTMRNNTIRYLEHVQAVISLRYYKRGDLQITLVSPSGTKSVLMPKRRYDHKPDGLTNWVLTSVHFWGESPHGIWRLMFENVGYSRHFTGDLTDWSLIFYGVGMRPLRIRRSTMEEIGAFAPLTSTTSASAYTSTVSVSSTSDSSTISSSPTTSISPTSTDFTSNAVTNATTTTTTTTTTSTAAATTTTEAYRSTSSHSTATSSPSTTTTTVTSTSTTSTSRLPSQASSKLAARFSGRPFTRQATRPTRPAARPNPRYTRSTSKPTTRPRYRNRPREARAADQEASKPEAAETVAHFPPYVSPEIDARLAAMHAVFIDYDGPCHAECAGGCSGPADHDCRACQHATLPDRHGMYRCLPYDGESDSSAEFEGEEEDAAQDSLRNHLPSVASSVSSQNFVILVASLLALSLARRMN